MGEYVSFMFLVILINLSLFFSSWKLYGHYFENKKINISATLFTTWLMLLFSIFMDIIFIFYK